MNGTLLAELLAFLIMLGLLAKYAFPPIMRAADARQKQIEEGLRAAEDAQKRLLAVQVEVERLVEEGRTQARELITRGHQDAAAEAEEVRLRGRREAEAQVEKARGDIEAERARAVQELRAQVGALVVEATGRVLGQTIDAAAHRRLIDESIASVSGES